MHIDLTVFRAACIAIAIFGVTSCVSGTLLLLPPHLLSRAKVARYCAYPLAFGCLEAQVLGLIWGVGFGLTVQVVLLGLTFDAAEVAAALMTGFILGGAAGLSIGIGTKVWRTVRQHHPPVSTLSWAKVAGSIVVGCFLGWSNHAPTTVSERVVSMFWGGIGSATIPFLPVTEHWIEKLLNSRRVAYSLALISSGAIITAIAFWLRSSIGGA